MEKPNFTKGMTWREIKIKKKQYRQAKKMKLMEKAEKHEAKAKLKNPIVESIPVKQNCTISIALPGNILDNAQSPALKTYLAGQIARASAIFNVNEIIIFSETGIPSVVEDQETLKLHQKNHGCVQLVRILQYLECPQYLRRYFFPLHKDLEYAGLLNPLDIPHHLRASDKSEFREGVVLNKPVKEGRGSYVDIGLEKTAIIDKVLEPHVRVTVQLDKEQTLRKHFRGKAVSPTTPFKYAGIYWGYNVRLARNLGAVFSESPYKGGYDVTIGTSDKGSEIDSFQMSSFKHLLIVFGGLKGLESCIESDETLEANEPQDLFQHYLNTCPHQGSRIIRTEEAVLITLAALRPAINELQNIPQNGIVDTSSQELQML